MKKTILTSEAIRQIASKATRKVYNAFIQEKNIINKSEISHSNISDYKKIDEEYNNFLKFIENIDKKILKELIKGLQLEYQKILKELFDESFNLKQDIKDDYETKGIIINRVFPEMLKIIHIIVFNKIDIKFNKDAFLPKNIYGYFIDNTKDEVDISIEKLTSKERLVLFEFYDMYTGEFYLEKQITENKKIELYAILVKIDTELKSKKRRKNMKGQ